MPARLHCCLSCVIAFVGGMLAADGPSLGVKRSPAPIVLDGKLNEAAWREASFVKLVQQSPKPGEKTPYETEVRIAVTNDGIYVGFLCRDPEPGRTAIHTMKRDDEMEGDDTVAVVLDTYGDKRTGYAFRVNAAGARADGLISGPEHLSMDWDGIWDARTARTEDGWSAEIVIPSRTLSFTPGLDEWGANFERFVARDRVTLRWSSPTLDSFLYDLSRAGKLTGVGELEQGRGIEVSPYMIGRVKNSFEGPSSRAWQGAPGMDVTWKVTPQIVTVFTANTDFAETEVDSRQINLTRFPLFFPEKRAFFLEGANQYEFGLNMGEEFMPFFSRRIGLLGGAQVPIDGGVKLNGRAGRWNLAMLDVETREAKTGFGVVPRTNLFASRISYDVTSRFRAGAIVTNGDPTGAGRNTLAGVDAVWRTSTFRGDKNLLLGAWTAMTTGGHEQAGRRNGWGLKLDYPNDLWDCRAGVNDFGIALNPALGFLPRRGVRMTELACSLQPRPSKDGPLAFIRQEFFENEYTRVTNHQGYTESWGYFMAPVNVRLESGDRFEFNWSPQYEYLAAPFDIAPGVSIPAGAYRFTRWRLEAQTSDHRPWHAGFTTWFGTFYSGRLTQWENYVAWTSPEGRLQLGLQAENNFGHLREGRFVQRLWQAQTAFALNPNAVLTSFIQYDTESQNFGTNTRLRWTIEPGNDLFIVWNRGWQRLITDPHQLSLIPDSELLAVKLRWTFRK
jgi:hypothetical protein